jgi:hypothetical protein
MTPLRPLTFVAIAFAIFGSILLVSPVLMVLKRARAWDGVVGLFIAGWGFMLLGAGTYFADRGWGNLVVLGVLVTTAGHLIQGRAGRR